MKILILGCDGFTGFPLSIHLLKKGYEVFGVDNFKRRRMVEELGSQSVTPIARPKKRWGALQDLGDFSFREFDTAAPEGHERLIEILQDFNPDSIINLAQQPSAGYSMKSLANAYFTLTNNNLGLLNLFWALRKTDKKKVPIIHLGSMGEWGQSVNLPIPEGFFKVNYKSHSDVIPFPRSTGSLYHCSKAQMSQLAWFACRIWELRDTDVHQGIIFGMRGPDNLGGIYRTRLDQDECFGTVVNRFVCCAVKGIPLPIYGSGMQTRAMLPLKDAIRCITLLAENPPTDKDSLHSYRVVNQFTKNYSVNDIAAMVKEIGEKDFGLTVEAKHIENPRMEDEVHFYQPESNKLENLGFEPSTTLEEEIRIAFQDVLQHSNRIMGDRIHPHIKWRQ